MELYAIGKVDEFGKVFDLPEFYRHLEEHKEFVCNKAKKDDYYREILEELEKITPSHCESASVLLKLSRKWPWKKTHKKG